MGSNTFNIGIDCSLICSYHIAIFSMKLRTCIRKCNLTH